ncbi:MAG: porin family protein [Gemmatimonadales bacterium]|nr:porin family protein [Gemmatimonadales bacterium]
MRIRAIVALLTALPAAPLAAQAELGVKVGMTFGNISNKGVLPGDLETRNGVAGGLALAARGGVVGVGIEALYAQRGLRSDQSLATARARLDYIDIPAYLRVSLPTPGVRPFVYAGPQVSFEVKCRRANGADCQPEISGERDKTTYAGVIGAGVRLGGRTGLTVEGRYLYGLSDLKMETITSSDSFRHRTLLILIGVGN